MRVAYVDHSFHRETRSSDFFRQLLTTVSDIDIFWDDSWRGGAPAPCEAIVEGDYDAIVVWQTETAAAQISGLRPHCPLAFVPMWDSSGSFGMDFWRKDLSGARVVCFCSLQAEQLARWGADVMTVRYWPEPPIKAQELRTDKIHGLFWWRREELPLRRIFQLCDLERMHSLHVHLGADPAHKLDEAQLIDAPLPLTVTRWGADADAYRKALADADLVFAPRLQEGIGATVFEAMAAGKVVVAADHATMNEYITDGLTGFLVPDNYTSSVTLDSIREIGHRARQAAIRGHSDWLEKQSGLLEWMLKHRGTGRKTFTTGFASSANEESARNSGPESASAPLAVGNYAEVIEGFTAERRILLTPSWSKWAADLAELLPRVPIPQSMVGSGSPFDSISPDEFVALLRSRELRHLEEVVTVFPGSGPLMRRHRLRFQAHVLRAWGFPASDVDLALKRKLCELRDQDYESAVARRRVWRHPHLWVEWWRRSWSAWREQGIRGGFRLFLALFRQNASRRATYLVA